MHAADAPGLCRSRRGALDERVRELAEGRAYNLQPFRRPLPPYPEIEWTRLTQASQAAVTDGLPGAPGRAWPERGAGRIPRQQAATWTTCGGCWRATAR